VEGGLEGMQRACGPAVGVPVHPMLGKITRSLGEVLTALEGKEFQAEFKYDGCRAQIHFQAEDGARANATFRIFSRHLEDMTTRYPDAARAVLDAAEDGTRGKTVRAVNTKPSSSCPRSRSRVMWRGPGSGKTPRTSPA
jgi:DNA ligase-1